MKRAVVALVIIGAAVVAAPAEAHYCPRSAQIPPRQKLDDGWAAVIGTVASISLSTKTDDFLEYRIDVEEALNLEVDASIQVASPPEINAFHLDFEVGDRVGLFLEDRDGVWHSDSCYRVLPHVLAAAAEPRDAPETGEPAKLFLSHSDSTWKLSRDGMVIEYRKTPGPVEVCRDRSLVVQRSGALIVRDMVSWEESESFVFADESDEEDVTPVGSIDGYPYEVHCYDTELGIYLSGPDDRHPGFGWVSHIADGYLRDVFFGSMDWESVSFHPVEPYAYFSGGDRDDRKMLELDLKSGEATELFGIVGFGHNDVSPDGSTLLVHSGNFFWIVDLDDQPHPVRFEEIPADRYSRGWAPAWVDNETWTLGGPWVNRIYDKWFRPVASFQRELPLNGGKSDGLSAFYIHEGRLFEIDRSGRQQKIRDLEEPFVELAVVASDKTDSAPAIAPPLSHRLGLSGAGPISVFLVSIAIFLTSLLALIHRSLSGPAKRKP